ncbi:MAG: IPT/TIG domain-containing protein [Solirubrobacteraceae bacterium]
MTRSGNLLAAQNPAQRMGVRFARSGVLVSHGALRFGLSLGRLDYGRRGLGLDRAQPSSSDNRVVYDQPGLAEWYVNGSAGLEQGFTLQHGAPAAQGESVTIAMSMQGTARAELAPGSASLLISRAGAPSLSYGALSATDARGHRLGVGLELHGRTLLLRVDTRGARYPVRIDPLLAEAPTVPSPAGEGSQFGAGLALSADGTTAIVGAPHDGRSGAAWIYTRSGTTWTREGGPLTGIEPTEPCAPEEPGEPATCQFGLAVALSGDGKTALIGAPGENSDRGAAWLFTRSGSSWVPGPELQGGEESGPGHFGRSVAISGDGNTAVIGGPWDGHGSGAAWVFTRSESGWVQQGPKLTSSEPSGEARFGRSVAISGDGSTALIGAPDYGAGLGAAWVFAPGGGEWTEQGPALTSGEPSGEEHFGHSVALSSDGTTALIGAPDHDKYVGAAWAFRRTGGEWSQPGTDLTAPPPHRQSLLGSSVALSGSGDLALAGGYGTELANGTVWEFSRFGEEWTEAGQATFAPEANHAHLGASVALSSDGEVALAGGPFYDLEAGGVWGVQESLLPAPSVATIEPGSGPAEGGSAVTITGSGFLPGATVTIGGAASKVEVVSGSEITATTSAGAGASEVVVSDAGGTSTGGPSFTYLAPPGEPGPTTNTSVLGMLSRSGILASSNETPPPPLLDRTGNLAPVSGRVLVKLPGSSQFVPLNGLTQVPFGTIVNATNGKVVVTTIGPTGRLQTITFYAGVFELLQQGKGRVLATLMGGNFTVCPTARERAHHARTSTTHATRSHTVRKLWASGHGAYATKGNYAAGAVQGTTWLTEDECDGTLIYVATDRVAVTNLVNHHHRIVTAHHTYFAAAP